MEKTKHKAGFVNIIGSPNVGKSTLMNVLVGEKLSIITSKAQTTRHRIMGIVNGDDFQIIYSDTPGVLKPNYKLQESMMGFVNTALLDADVILFVTDIYEDAFEHEAVLTKVQESGAYLLVLINKIDLGNEDLINSRVEYWKTKLPGAEILALSALKAFNTQGVFQKIIDHLPESDPFYPKDQLTDKPERFFVAEIIREKIFFNYKKEVPYSCEVVINSFKEEDKIIRIEADIYVARDSQKGILIGEGGKALKKVGIMARKDIEAFFEKHVHIGLHVKVNKDWRDNDLQLKRFGYNN